MNPLNTILKGIAIYSLITYIWLVISALALVVVSLLYMGLDVLATEMGVTLFDGGLQSFLAWVITIGKWAILLPLGFIVFMLALIADYGLPLVIGIVNWIIVDVINLASTGIPIPEFDTAGWIQTYVQFSAVIADLLVIPEGV